MDSAATSNRMFPGYTLAQLQGWVDEGVTDMRPQSKVDMMKSEIDARVNGKSKHKSTPQVSWANLK